MRNRINWVLQRPILAELKDKYFRVKKALETPKLIPSYGIREGEAWPESTQQGGCTGRTAFHPVLTQALRRVNSDLSDCY